MFRHLGKSRTLNHNKRIASLLSFVAGMVNVAGFLSVKILTTNVTGHFAFFVDEIFKFHFAKSFIYFFYILFFFLGSFSSNFILEFMMERKKRFVYTIPVMIECIILFLVPFLGAILTKHHPNVIAFSLLFVMGLQNSFVTKISGAMVRTTHLTGLFTDLGIELSQLFFYKETKHRKQLIATIRLRLRIISFFFLGGILGGVFYSEFKLYVLLIPAVILIVGLLYDSMKFKWIHRKRKKRLHLNGAPKD